MKTQLSLKHPLRSGYALIMVMVLTVASVVIMGGTLNRTYSVSKLNDRSNQLVLCQNAAEAAVEKAFARMQYDFQSQGGAMVVSSKVPNYRAGIPNEDSYWSNFIFSNGSGSNNQTYVAQISTFTGTLPSFYSGRVTANAPVYRIMSNARWNGGGSTITGAAQEDVMLALVPLTTYAIFYNGLLEFSTCATMTVNGPVHCNTNIFVGAGGSATLTFNTEVTASGTISAPTNNGANWGNPTNFNASWRTTFAGTPTNYVTNIASIQISLPMTNAHSIIEMPTTANDWTNAVGQSRVYNQAQIILLVSNTSVTTIIQQAPVGSLPASDTTPYITTYSTNLSVLTNNLPFLCLTNLFYDGREKTTNLTTQIDVGRYGNWTSTNAQVVGNGSVVGKYPSGSGYYPTILYVADNRTAGSSQLAVIRLTNGISPPSNGGQGFTVATPNPLYVWGNYNQTNTSYLGTTNTSGGTVPCAFLSDALTVLSSSWSDKTSFSNFTSASWNASATNTVNAAIITGVVPSSDTDNLHFSGGVHNLPRLLEDWSSSTLWLNTSIVNLFNSNRATNQFLNPGPYYNPPTRKFSYDQNFSNANNVPPGIPCALVALRYNWAVPPPGVTNYNVIP